MLHPNGEAGSTRYGTAKGGWVVGCRDGGSGSLTARSVATAREVLAGRRRGLSAYLAFVGPAVVASIAYVDPGNFATNIQAGAKYGYDLLWVVLAANLIAMLFQALSAKLGIVTGRNLAEMCRDEFPPVVVWTMWIVSELAAMATDLAEFLGGAIGLALLFQVPLLVGMGITACITYGILMFERSGFRPIELIISSLVGLIALCYLVEMFIAPVDWGAAAFHTVVPQIADAGAQRRREAPGAALLQSGSRRRAHNRRRREHGDGDDGVERLPCRLQRCGGDRNGISYLDAPAWRRRGRRLPAVPHCVRHLKLGGRHHGRPDDYAGVCRLPHSARGAPPRHHGAGLCGGSARRQCHQGSGHQPGHALDRAAAPDDCALDVHPPSRPHGRLRQWAGDQSGCAPRNRRGSGAQRDPDSAHPRTADPGVIRERG